MVVPFLFAATRNRMFAGSVCVQLSLSHRSSYIWLGNPGLVDRRLDLASLEMEKKVPAAAVKWIIKRHVLSLPCCFRPSPWRTGGIRWFPTNFFPHFPTYVIDTSSNANEVIEQQSAILFQAVELAKQNACASGRAVPKCRDFHGS